MFEHFEYAFRRHQEMVECMTNMHFAHMMTLPNVNHTAPRRPSSVSAVNRRSTVSYHPVQDNHGRRKNTLLREGIKPAISNELTASKKGASTSYKISHRVSPFDDEWICISPEGSGVMTVLDSEITFNSSSEKSFSCIHQPRDHDTIKLCCDVTPSYVVEMNIKSIKSHTTSRFKILLGYNQSKSYYVVVDFTSRTIKLLQIFKKDLREVVFCSATTEELDIKANVYFNVIAKVNNNFLSVLINGCTIMDYDQDQCDIMTNQSSVFSGLPGIFCSRNNTVVCTDWSVKPTAIFNNEIVPLRFNPIDPVTNSVKKIEHKSVKGKTVALNSDAVRNTKKSNQSLIKPSAPMDEAIQSIVMNEVLQSNLGTTLDDISGLSDQKRVLTEAVLLPLLIPEVFTGIREPWKGVLLFGPPGTGKTMLVKGMAGMTKSTFFNCSAASLTSKYRGESEKIVKCLFETARTNAPSIIFIDEIDALLTDRNLGGNGSNEHEASRRLKTEFFVQMDGIFSAKASVDGVLPRVMLLCTTNCPWDLDPAMLRRLEKRLYIPLPDLATRTQQFCKAIESLALTNSPSDASNDEMIVHQLALKTEGFSGADINIICREAAMSPMRRLLKQPAEGFNGGKNWIHDVESLRQSGQFSALEVTHGDFLEAISNTKPSVNEKSIKKYEEWNEKFGSQ